MRRTFSPALGLVPSGSSLTFGVSSSPSPEQFGANSNPNQNQNPNSSHSPSSAIAPKFDSRIASSEPSTVLFVNRDGDGSSSFSSPSMGVDWRMMPMDLLCLIFSALNISDLYSCCRVSRIWRIATNSPISWRSAHYNFKFNPKETTTRITSKLLSILKKPTRIELKMNSIRLVGSLRVEAEGGVGIPLRHFRLCLNPNVLSHLLSLQLEFRSLTHKHIQVILGFTKLEKLSLGRGTTGGIIPALSSTSGSLPSLRELYLYHCNLIPAKDFQFLPLSLTVLDVSFCNVDWYGWRRIGEMSLIKLTVRALEVCRLSLLSEGIVQLYTTHCADTLKHLTFGGEFHENTTDPSKPPSFLAWFPSLIQLDFTSARLTFTEWMKLIEAIRIRRELNPHQPFNFSEGGSFVLKYERNVPRWFRLPLFLFLFFFEYADEQLGKLTPDRLLGLSNISHAFLVKAIKARRSPKWSRMYSLIKRMCAVNWADPGPELLDRIQCPLCDAKLNTTESPPSFLHVGGCTNFRFT